MKYSELISFKPIESTIQLLETAEKSAARDAVSTYVMSDSMAENMKAPVIDQLQMEEVVDNKAIMIVGNFGTGKSHLMSVIAAVATDADNLQYLQNKNFAKDIEVIAGKFEVLRMKVDGLTMPLREIIMGEIEDDFRSRGITYTMPDLDKVRDNSKIIKDAMTLFQAKYPDKGYMIVIDELLSYLTSRDGMQIVLDLAFLQSMAELCSKSKLRVICGVQEKVFDNPKFSFVSDTLKKVGDRFTQLIITKEATAYVVSERILKKTPEQKAWIREHLEKFTNLYSGMSSRLEEFVDLYPIHPSYIDVFNRIYLIENRHILRNISICIRKIFDTNVPEAAPGIISFDDYWPAIKGNGLLKSDPTISKVLNASQQLEDIINRAFAKPAYKPMALQIIYALSVHRLTTNGLDVQFGMTAENLKDDLCLYLPMPEQDADFLLGAVNATLKEIMTTVSGQFIIHNDANNQYYIDVDKIVDYDEKIRQKASTLAESELNMYFYNAVYSCLEWDAKQYVTNFNIYEYDLNWDSHNIFREGYLFMGLPGERSTAQPERDFYIHIMPPYGNKGDSVKNLPDEVYLYFKSSDDFKDNLSLHAAATALSQISEGKDRDAYNDKANTHRRKLVRYLSENKNTCFDISYNNQRRQMIEVLKGKYKPDLGFRETIDLAASSVFDPYFNEKYPDFPVFKTKITRKNQAQAVREAFDFFAGRKTQLATMMVQSFDLLDGEKIKPENSKYALYYINELKKLPTKSVLNYTDLFDEGFMSEWFDKKFKLSFLFTPIIFLSMVYAGYAVITLKNGKTVSASNLDEVTKIGVYDLYEFKYISRPTEIAMAELKHMFDVLDLNPALLDLASNRDKAVSDLLNKAQALSNNSVYAEKKITDGFDLWGESMVDNIVLHKMQSACSSVKNEFSNYSVKYNTAAKLNNFTHTMDEIDEIAENIRLMNLVEEYSRFKSNVSEIVNYISNIEFIDLGEGFKSQLKNAKGDFKAIRDNIASGTTADVASQKADKVLSKIKDQYINIYFDEHKKKRLGINDANRKGKIQESRDLANLKRLRNIEILSSAKLSTIEQDLAGLTVCYELTPEELKSNYKCPHCGFSIGDKAKNVFGQLDNIENRIEDLGKEWAKTLSDTISDPIVASQKEYLSVNQQKAIDEFITTGELPRKVDDFFVNAVSALLQGFDPVVVDADSLLQKLEQLPPMNESAFEAKIAEILSAYTKGKDKNKLRIIVKRKDSEV